MTYASSCYNRKNVFCFIPSNTSVFQKRTHNKYHSCKNKFFIFKLLISIRNSLLLYQEDKTADSNWVVNRPICFYSLMFYWWAKSKRNEATRRFKLIIYIQSSQTSFVQKWVKEIRMYKRCRENWGRRQVVRRLWH